jgi:hypothetical protein
VTGHGCQWHSLNGHQVYGVPAPENFAARPLTRRDLRSVDLAGRRSDLEALGVVAATGLGAAVVLGTLWLWELLATSAGWR